MLRPILERAERCPSYPRHRCAAGQGGGAGHGRRSIGELVAPACCRAAGTGPSRCRGTGRRQGGGAAVPPVPHPRGQRRRLRARSRDAVHRRSHGDRLEFPAAFAKAQLASGNALPTSGRVYVSVATGPLPRVATTLRTLQGIGFEVVTDKETARLLSCAGVTAAAPAEADDQVAVARWINDGEISLVISIGAGGQDRDGDLPVRSAPPRRSTPSPTSPPSPDCWQWAARSGPGTGSISRSARCRTRIPVQTDCGDHIDH